MRHPFLRNIDWERLKKKEVTPPIIPTAAVELPQGNISLSQTPDSYKADRKFDNFSYTESNNYNCL